MTIRSSTPGSILSRRRLLQGAGLAAAAACLAASAMPALAQQGNGVGCSVLIPRKSSKEDARFIHVSYSGRRCGGCRFFKEPNACLVVDGEVDANSVCSLWAQRGGRVGCVPDEPIKL